ncbi:sigma-54 interaction domain-containing protein [Stutzerimonas nitrititolerans]|uniref:sigma-54 interaction domain-containing protein n=1 Tax=Stutzerimonas nitrititolerans TaxID=2482751 RepID=UPI0028974755|nr:sigma 54-interacting transcriptional regulator [Stutzerimonas nitrititolerans]
MTSTNEFVAALVSQLPIGIMGKSQVGTVWINEYLSSRHIRLRLAIDHWQEPELETWAQTGTFSDSLLEIDGEHYLVASHQVLGDSALVFWPSSAVAMFSPQVKQLEQLYLDFREIYRNSFDGIFITDGAGKTLMVNEGCERNYGIVAADLVGKNVFELERAGLIRPVIAPRVIATRERVTSIQETRIGKTIMVTGIPLLDEQGNVRKVIINSRDTTELLQLQEELARAQEKLRRYALEVSQLRMSGPAIAGIVLRSPSMQQISTLAMKVSSVDTTVLITGESGVGKEVMARLIHTESSRSEGPFVKINCGAIPRELLESELFGYDAGAFTGAQRQGKIGMIEVANHGTLFLDEIGELPLDLQVKLLQVLQDKTLVRLGSTRSIAVSVRVVAATNRDLQAMVDSRQFRSDLFYRLNVVPLHVPPLRERREDILPLVQHFLDELNGQYNLTKRFSEQALAALLDHSWPGNVRELRNMIERLVVTTPDALIRTDYLPPQLCVARNGDHEAGPADLRARTARFERELVLEAVERFGSTRAAAKHLKISQSSVVRRMKPDA